jgi:hypothetical protein
MAHLILAGVDHVEDAEGRLVLVRGVDPDFHFAARHFLDEVGHLDDGVAEDRESRPPCLGQFPDDRFLLSLGLRRRRGLLLLLLLFPASPQCQQGTEHQQAGERFQNILQLFHFSDPF